MPDIKNNIKVIYNALAKEGYNDLGSEQEFAESMADENNRKLVYNTLKGKEFADVKDYDSFSNMVYQQPRAEQQQEEEIKPVKPAKIDPRFVAPNVGKPTDAQPIMKSVQQDTGFTAPQDYNSQNAFLSNVDKDYNVASHIPDAQQPIKMYGADSNLGEVIDNLYTVYDEAYKKDNPKKIAEAANMARSMGLDNEQAEKALTLVHGLYSQNVANNIADYMYSRMNNGDPLYALKEVYYNKDFQKKLKDTTTRLGLDNTQGFVEYYLKPALQRKLENERGFTDTVNFGVQSGIDDIAKNTEVFEKRKAEEDLLQKQVDAMNAEGKRIEEKGQQMYDPNYKDRPWWADLIPVEGGGRSAYDEAEGIKRNPEAEELMRTGQAMQRMADDAQAAISEDNILRTRKTDGLTNQIKNAFGRILRGGAKTATDIRTWDFGFTDLKDATVIKAAADAYANNRATAAQKALLNGVALKNAVMGKHGDSLGGLYGAAGTTIQMVPFMAQFAFSPVKGVGPAAQKYCRTQLEKAFGKYATEAVGKFVIKSGELAGRFVGDVAQGAAMTTIFNMPAVAADTHKRMTGDLEAATDSKGNIVYSGKRTNVKSGGRAFAEAFTAQTIENQSELVGEYFAPLQEFIQKGAIKALDKWGLSKTKDFLTGINNKQIMKGFNRFTKKTEWNKLLGETGEEFIGNIENAATVGDLNFKLDPDDDNSIFSKKVNTDIILGVGLGCGIISGARVGSYIRNNRKLNTAINDADTHADVIFGTDRWQQIKSEIDNAPDDKAGSLLQSYINNAKLNNEQKQTIVDYTVNTYIKRGNDISHLKNAIEDNISSEQQEVQSAYENGQNARDAQMNEVKTSLDEAEKHAAEVLGEDELNALDGVEDVDAFKESNAYKSYSEEQREAALKYIIARTAYNGMINRVQDEIKAAVNKTNAEIDNLTHKDSGTIIRATLKNGDQEVYVVSGNVATSPDGKSIDTEKSDSDIVVYNTENGKKEMLNIKDLQSVDTPIDAATYKADSAAETTQQIAEAEAAKIDGTRSFHYNDTVKVQDKEGNLIDGSVQDVTPDGIIVVSDAYPGGKTYTAAELTAMQPQPQTVAENATVEQQAEEAVADNESNEAPAEEKGEANSPQSEATPQEETAEPQQQAVEPQQQAIPTDEKGNLLYHEVPVERTIEDLYDGSLDDTEITDFISANIEAAQKEYNSVVKKAPKIGTDKARYLQEKKAYQEEVGKAKAKVDYWQAVENERQRITHTSPEELKNEEDELSGEAARKDYRGITTGDEENPTSVEDLVRDFLRGAKITPEDFRKETGLSISEQKKFVGMISKQGKTIARLGEELADYDAMNLGGRFFDGDSNAARGAIIDVLLSSRTRGDFKQQDATEEEERYIEAVEQQREQWYYENYHMTYEEYLQYREIVLPELLRKYANFAPDVLYPQFVASFEDAYAAEHSQTNNTENNEQQRNDTTTEEPTTTPGDTVLQTEETNNSRGDSQSEEQPTEVPTGVRSSNENGTLPQSTPTEVDKEPLSEEAAQSLITSMEENAIEDPEIRLTPQTWLETFGINNSIDTPIGKVRMGENQYAKLQDKKRTSEFGMISLTLSDPDVIFVEPSKAKGEDVAERNFSYVFAKTFKRNGNKVKYYTSVTVSIDGLEISVSSHFVNPNKMLNKLMEFNREYTKETLFSNSSEMRLAEHQSDVPDLLPTQENNVSSDSKVTQSSQTKQEKENKFSPTPRKDGESITDYAERVAEEHQAQRTRKEEEAKVDTNPTDAQKEAGNYKKGHIKVDGLNITIEQPKGSIRRGTDANGKQWESEMHNTYGYIRGTESVDGDHIDIFLSDNPTEGKVFVVDQVNKDGSFDEHKVMYGFPDMESAKRAYLSNYEEGWQGLGNITEVSKEDFKAWIDSSKRKTKPFAEYTSVKTQDDTQTKKPTEENAAPANTQTNENYAHNSEEIIRKDEDGDASNLLTDNHNEQEQSEKEAEDFARQDLKELEDFQKNTDTTGRTAIDEDRYDAEDLFAALKLDGKPSKLGVLTVVPDKITDPVIQIAVYDYSDEIDDKTNSGWQKWGDLADEYNKTVDKDDKAQERGDTATLGFRTVDAAVKFNDWLNTDGQTKHQTKKTKKESKDNNVFLSQKEYVEKELKSVLKQTRYKTLEEWESKDVGDYSEKYDDLLDTYEDYVRDLADDERLQAIYDSSSVKAQKEMREHLTDADLDYHEFINTSPKRIRIQERLTRKSKYAKGEFADGTIVSGEVIRWSPTSLTVNSRGTIYTIKANKVLQQSDKPMNADEHEYQRDASLQYSGETLTNDTEAKQKATEAVLAALSKAGIEVVRATDEEVKALLSNSHATTLRTPQGTIYGWSVNGKIYLTEAGINPDTPIHEYTHLWAEAMMIKNKKGWDSIKVLLKDNLIWNEVVADANYSNIADNEDAVASEVLSRISGRKNATKMEEEAQRAIDEAKGVFKKAEATTILLNLKRAIKQFWHWVGKNVFGIKDFKNIDEVTDRILYDLLSNTKLTEEDNKEIAKRDKLYLDAVERGDMETAQRMVNEAAVQNGYVPNSEYQGSSAFNGAAPYGNGYFLTKEERKEAYENDEFDGDTSLDDYVNSGIDPMNLDYLTNDSSYRHADDARKEAIENLRNVFQNKRQTITMYRSVPSSIKEGSFRNGDWVTPSYAYAVENARVHGWGNNYRIIEQKVPISDVWFDGNDIAEFGYGNENDFINDKDYLYSNTKNNRKLPDAVTYDDKGNVIPLSKRFNKAKSDTRFQIVDNSLSDEEKKIVETAKANDTYMKAPNGKPTNLSEKQWAQVRTTAFKNWFGDWEKAARIEKVRRSKAVVISGSEYKDKYELNRDSAKEWIKDNLRGEYTIADTEEIVSLTKVGANKVTSHGMSNKAHLQSIAAIPQLIRHAIFIEERPNEKHNNKYDSYKYYICGLKIGTTDYTVKLTIGVKSGKKYYDHALTEIEKGKLLDRINDQADKKGFTTTGDAPLQSYALSIGKDSKLLSILQTNSSKVVDENGEPMVVYHGTLADGLRQFSTDFIGSRYSYDEKGFFFISNRKIADDYAVSEFDASRRGEVIDAYVSLGNPLVVNSEWCRKNGLGSNVFKDNDVIEFWDNYQSLIVEESEQNDGVIVTDGETSMVVAFFPNQIKSATGNNGNFSTTEDDILYRTVFGGNSGYVGYSMSKRAAEAKEEGRYPKTEFRREYHITAKSLDMLTSLGFIDNSEWHHTSMYGNKTPFYGWAEDELADDYLKHKKEIDTLCKGIDPKTKQPLIEKVEKPQYEYKFELPQYNEAATAANPIIEWRHKQIEKYDQFTGFKGYAYETKEKKKERDAYLHSLNEQMEEKIREMLAKDYPDYLAAKNALDAYNNYEEDLRKAIGERIKEYLDIDKYSQRWREQTATTQPTANIETLTNHAESVVQNLHLNNVEIVPDGSSLNGEQATAKGFYNKRTGKIVVVAGNHTDIADIEKTVLHEAVAHHGLRELFGDNFDNFLDTVFAKADIETRQQIAHLSAKHGWNIRTATEEYLASMAEDTNFEQIKPTLWQRIKQLFGEIMSAFGLHHANITDNDLRYILWRSYKNLQNSGKHSILDKAEDIAMQYRLKAGNYADKATDNVLYRSSIDHTATEVLPDARTRYEKETKEPDNIDSVPKTHNFFRRFYKSYVDSMLALKSFTNSVLEATGDKMASHEDTYKAENAMTSKNKTDGEVYNRDYYNPLLTAAQQLCEAVGMDYDALNMYMVAKHGLERNEYMGKRAAQNDENVLKAKKALEDALVAYNEDPTSKNEAAVQKAQEKYTKVYDKALEVHTSRDYSGLTELTDKEDVAEAEYEAQKIVDAVETPDAMPKVTAFWSKVNAATKQTLKTGYESGIMTKDTYEHILNMYKYYIPLRGWAEPTADDVYTYYNNRSYEGKPLTKTAKGRTSLAEDPMAIIASMAQRSIIEANRNKMKQTFLNFVLNHPTSLATVGEQWYIKNALGEWERSDANIPANATPDEISKIIEEHELEMQRLAEQGAAIKQRNGLKLDKRVINGEGAEHTIKVWRGGKEYVIYINGNPAVAQAVNGLTNPDTQGSDLPKWAKIGAAQLKNFLSGVYTSFSPAFVLTNFTRDQLFASQAVYIKYGLKYKRQASKNARNLLFSGALPRLVYKWEHGTLNMNDETERYFDEFMRGGGETGFTALRDIESIKKEVKDAVNGNKANIAKRGWKSFINAVEFANRSAEDFSRFVTFMTSRQQGKNIVDAIYDAKDITVNFNKKGSGEMGSRFMNFAYIFFNAAVQSINNFGTMLKQHPARTMLVISKFGALGFGVPMLNAFLTALCGGGDDDKYWDNMDWVRRNNIVLRIPFLEKTFISIPLPQELRPFYGMGEIAASILFGKETFSSGLQKAVEGFTGLLPIDFTGNGGNLPITLTPTVLQPVAQYMFNTDYFGRKVYNDNEKKKFAPGWTKAFSSTPPLLIDATKFFNSLTGGNDVDRGGVNLNPDVINHFVKGYFGGPATFVTQMSSLLYKGFKGNAKEIRWRDVPVASRFVQQLDERSVRSSAQGSYKDFKEETEETEYRLSNYKKQVKMGKMEYAKMITDLIKSPEYQRYKIAKAYKKPMDLLQETLSHIDNTTDKKEVEKALTGLRHYMMETVESEQKGKHAKREEDFNYLGDNLSELNNNLKSSLRSLKRNEEQRLDGEEDDGIEELISEDKETTMRIIREMNKLFKKK